VNAVIRTTTRTPRPMLASAVSTLPPPDTFPGCDQSGVGQVFGVRARRYSLLPLVVRLLVFHREYLDESCGPILMAALGKAS
jgi:hypothetical protein